LLDEVNFRRSEGSQGLSLGGVW